ncbi:MAG: putative photosynthetic complex assembly protein PuhE [Pseudomonadota bacterium]
MTSVLAFVFAVVTWWVTTGLVAFAVRVGDDNRGSVMVIFGLLGAVGVGGLFWSSGHANVLATYVGFVSALAVWAFHEAAFLMGLVTGSRPLPCPEGASGARRFSFAFRAVNHHEIGLFLTVLLIVVLAIGSANPTGALLLLLMWAMRLSTKFIVFLGAPNAISDLMPPRVRHLHSYFRTDRVTPFLPISLALSICLLITLIDATARADMAYAVVGHVLLSTFLLLAIAEHLFLVLPMRDAALWGWATRSDKKTATVDRLQCAKTEHRKLMKMEISPSIQRSRRSVGAETTL